MSPPLRIGIVAALALLVAGAGLAAFWFLRGNESRDAIRAARPPVPLSVQSWPEEFRRRLTDANRDSIVKLAELSTLYHANGFIAEAMQCYRALENLQPKEPRWPHRHASLLAGFGEAEPALQRWRQVMNLAPDYLPAQQRLAELLAKTDRGADAATIYTAMLNRKPDEPYALLGLARLDVEAGRWTDARARLERVAQLTNYELGHDLLVSVYERLGLQTSALSVRARAKAAGTHRDAPDPWIEELMEQCFDAYRLSLAAGSEARAGDRTHALRLLARAVALTPDDATIRFQLAGLYAESGDVVRARAEYERCTTTAPSFPDAWAHLSALLERGGDLRGAESVLAAGLRACPQSPGLHLMLARRLRDSNRPAEAIAAYQTSIRYRPNEADAYLELATTLFRLERVAEGLQALHQAINAEPNHPMALALLALHAIGEKNEPAARKWLGAVLEQPRVPREQREQLLATFRSQFGRDLQSIEKSRN